MVPSREPEIPAGISSVLTMLANAFGIKRPPVYVDHDQLTAARLEVRARDGVLTPVLMLGRPALDATLYEHELTFLLARQLADLRTERIARLLCPRAGELAQIIELAAAPAGDSHATRWLQTSLHPVELDRALAIGARLRERGVHPMTAALGWVGVTDRVADRIGLVMIGDLATCVRMLEHEPGAPVTSPERVLELVWSSVSEDVLGVRGRVEGWGLATPPARKKTSTLSSV
jgi:hypothetical protein